MSVGRWGLLTLILGLSQGLFPLAGAILGTTCGHFIEAIDHWIAFILLLAIGIKMIIDATRKEGESLTGGNALNVRTMCMLGVATSIDAFAVGIGFGLDSTMTQNIVTCTIIATVTFAVSCLGVLLGQSGRRIPTLWSGIVAGAVLIGIGVKILAEHLAS